MKFLSSMLTAALLLACSSNFQQQYTAHAFSTTKSVVRYGAATSLHQAAHLKQKSVPSHSKNAPSLVACSMSKNGSTSSSLPIKTIASASSLVALDIFFRRLLKHFSISFPSSLAGCGTLFGVLLTIHAFNNELGDKVYGLLSPGAAILAKWLPVFFVPSLVTLPLAPSMGSATELAKIAAVIIGGFYFTLFSTAFSVLGIRKLQGKNTSDEANIESAVASSAAPSPAPKAFSDATFNTLAALAAGSGIATTIAARTGSALSTHLNSAFLFFTTLSTFVFGARLPKKFTKIVHPLVTCTALTWAAAKAVGSATSKSFSSMLNSYKIGSIRPPSGPGAGDILLFMLGPAVVSLACQMYDRKKLMAENVSEVSTAVAVSSIGGLFGTAVMVRLLNIANSVLRLCLLSRNITSPLAMAIAGIVGADVSLAVSMVVITGLIGANFGASILDSVGIKDAVARGMGIGAAAHGLGTAAFANEKDAFPFAAISMALTASACTVLVSVPAVKALVLKIALG
mmetsp:Transcript_9947/g.13296  ORF Transcript_9947/g.13296 Transcript_9947/m.13296 type:complete len:513 (-) Transcript_9947:123-1661(-)